MYQCASPGVGGGFWQKIYSLLKSYLFLPFFQIFLMSDPLRPLLIMKDYCQNPWVSWGPSPGDAHSYMLKVGVFRSLSSITRCRVLSSPIPIFDIGVLLLIRILVMQTIYSIRKYWGLLSTPSLRIQRQSIVNTDEYTILLPRGTQYSQSWIIQAIYSKFLLKGIQYSFYAGST